jgi:hypothetical protein
MSLEDHERPDHEQPRAPGEIEDEDTASEPPNEGSPGHHPDDDSKNEDLESEQSFPASDPPANY